MLFFGSGNFLRGFAAWMIDILNEKTNFNAGVHVVQPFSKVENMAFIKQEGLYHVITQGLKNGREINEPRLISCLQGITNPYLNYGAFLQLALLPDLQFIISNTTEAGPRFNPSDRSPQEFQNSFPGKLAALLYKRFQHTQGSPEAGVVVIPCELLEDNGKLLETLVLQYARLWDLPRAFDHWIRNHNTFCDTLVDRIVPGITEEKRERLESQLGFEDRLMITAEPYHLWAIANPDSTTPLFPAKEAGLQVVFAQSVTPYRLRKVRILNGAHTAMVPYGYLHGKKTVRESVEEEPTATFVSRLIFEEIIPATPLPEEELRLYAIEVIDRFKNPYIRHELLTISLQSIAKFRVRLLPTLQGYFRKKAELPQYLVRAMASLFIFYRGTYQRLQIPLKDDRKTIEFFKKAWEQENTKSTVHEILSNTELWSEDLNAVPGLAARVYHEVIDINVIFGDHNL